jgi:hypothetical protein
LINRDRKKNKIRIEGQIFILCPGSRKTTAFGWDVAPQGRYSETTVFARGAPQLVNFLEKNITFRQRIPKQADVRVKYPKRGRRERLEFGHFLTR